jgi:hypothetical protein
MRDNRAGSFNIPEWHITKSGQEPTIVAPFSSKFVTVLRVLARLLVTYQLIFHII